MPCDSFEELQIPTKVLATDIQTGNEIVYEEGNLKEAIIQSSSIPGFFEATFSNDKIIVDGGVSAPIPIEILRKYSKKVMAVDITNNELKPLVNPNMVEIMRRADIITSLKLKAKLSKEADILVRPDVSGIHWSDFNNFDKLLDSGRDAMTKVLDNLKASETSKKNKLYNLFESAK